MQRYQLDEDRATADIASPADERLLQRPFGVVEPTGDHRDRVVPAVARPLPGTDDSGSRVQSTVCKRPTSSEFDGRAHARELGVLQGVRTGTCPVMTEGF